MTESPDRVRVPGYGWGTIINSQPTKSDCIDGRPLKAIPSTGTVMYKQEPDHGSVRSPGATIGTMAAVRLAAPELSIQDTVELVVRWGLQGNKTPLFPTDHGDVCGHEELLEGGELEKEYGIKGADMRALREEFDNLVEAGMPIERAHLIGPHDEQGLLVVDGTDKTVAPQVGQDEDRFFRYDRAAHGERLSELAIYASTRGLSVSPKDLIAAAEQHANVTLGVLAPNAPIIVVDLRNERRSVEYAGEVTPVRRRKR